MLKAKRQVSVLTRSHEIGTVGSHGEDPTPDYKTLESVIQEMRNNLSSLTYEQSGSRGNLTRAEREALLITHFFEKLHKDGMISREMADFCSPSRQSIAKHKLILKNRGYNPSVTNRLLEPITFDIRQTTLILRADGPKELNPPPTTHSDIVPQIEKLRRVLLAYSCHDPDVGYCQGINHLAAVACCSRMPSGVWIASSTSTLLYQVTPGVPTDKITPITLQLPLLSIIQPKATA
ncbi:hypothetical protein EMCRGX_G023291 [Ephydatia muelleri]